MSSIDIQAVSAPVILPPTDSRPLSPSRAAVKTTARPSAGHIARVVFACLVLALAAAIVPVIAIYSFIWLAQIY